MTASLEFEAKNVNKAVIKACQDLNITENELNYHVISHGSSGIFGLARVKKAKIRVTLPKAPIETVKDDDNAQIEPAVEIEPVTPSVDTIPAAEREAVQRISFPDSPADLGRDILQRIVDTITDDASITINEDSHRIHFNIVGGNPAVLIGKRGQTLEAIQSLVEKILNKHNQNRIRIQIDVEGYLETRKENMEKMATKLAEKSKRIGKPISLKQMSAYERRIIHLALKNDTTVQTRSRGEGPMRKLVIFPNKKVKKLINKEN